MVEITVKFVVLFWRISVCNLPDKIDLGCVW
jgi:hypothetical protein